MPIYRVEGPDGRVFRITAPEGATEGQVLAYAQANAPAPDPAPKEGPWSRYQQSGEGPWTRYQNAGPNPKPDFSDVRGAVQVRGETTADLAAIEKALRAADAAGNVDDARRLAQAYADTRRQQQAVRLSEVTGTTPLRLSQVTGRQPKPDFSDVRGGSQTLQRQGKPGVYNGPLLTESRLAQGSALVPTLEAINAANRAAREAPGFAQEQAKIAAENRRAHFRSLPAPLRFGIGLGGRVDAVRRGVGQAYAWAADHVAPESLNLSDLIAGGNTSRFQRSMANEAQARERDAYMQGDTAAALGGFAGDVAMTMAPAGAVARLGGLRAVAGSAALGGGYAGLQPVVAGESRVDNAKAGAAFGAGGQLAGVGLSRLGRSAAAAVPKDVRLLTRRARELGIPVHASQVSQSLPVKVTAAAGKYLPFSGYGKAASAQQTAVNRAVARTFGSDAGKLTDDVMHSARRRLNAGFEDVYNRNAIPIGEKGARKLAQVEQRAMRRLTESEGRVLRNQLDDIFANAEGGALTGQKYQAVRSELMKSEGPDKLGQAIKELRKALDDVAADAVGPEDAAKLKELRSQWANFRTAENALKQNAGAGGDIRASALWPLVRNGSTREMRELARMGQTVLKEPIADSGTAQRTLAYNMLTGGVSLANPGLIPMVAKASLAGATVGRLANSSTLAQLLAREGRGVMSTRLGGLLEGSYPYVAPALAQYNEQRGR